MLRIAVCDDNNGFRESFKEILIKKSKIINIEIKFKSFKYAELCIKEHQKSKFDVIFMDIKMPKIDGFEAFEECKKICNKVEIVFTTSYDEMIYKAINYRPFGFIRKSYLETELEDILLRLKDIFEINPIFILAKKDTIAYKLEINDIYYIESNKNYLEIHTFNDIFLKRYKVSEIEKELSKSGFIKIHSGIIINKKYWVAIDDKDVLLENNIRLPISFSRRKFVEEEFLRQFRRI